MSFSFDYNSRNARRARLARFAQERKLMALSFGLFIALIAVALALSVSGVVLAGAVAAAVGIQLAMYGIWIKDGVTHDSATLSLDENVKIENALSGDVLAYLKGIESTKQIWQALNQSYGYAFLANHFQIDHQMLDATFTNDSMAPEPCLETAVDLARKHGHHRISAGPLFVGLVRQRPNPDQFLAPFHITLEELESAIDWLHHRQQILEAQTHRHGMPGGIARDWTSGFTPLLNKKAFDMTAVLEHSARLRLRNARRQTVDEMIKALSPAGSGTVLVGRNGSGKTTLVQAFAQRLITESSVPNDIRYHRVYELNAAELLAGAQQDQLEALFLAIFNEAHKAKNIILFFDDAEAFFTDQAGAMDVAKVLQPIIKNRVARTIFATEPAAWQRIENDNPALAGSLQVIRMPELDEKQAIRLIEDHALFMEAKYGLRFTYQAIREAYRLGARYERSLAQPGAAIKLLEEATTHAQNKLVTDTSVRAVVEATQGVKLQQSNTEDAQTLLNLETKIHQRMVNQDRAVSVVSDALRRARSGVANPEKPVGAFLFLGPTGVGKTELAKALAAEYFGGEDKIVRLDMNEFTGSADANRLLDASSPNSLLSAVARNPFSVVLLDEIEKAHPDIVNAFLQMLEEGEMRDSQNNTVSFKDAIIISTSNAGADTIRRYIEEGQELEQFEQPFIDQLINGNIFKPEFINRFDETVVFRPLKDNELLRVVDILLAEFNKTLSRQNIKVDLTKDAKQWLVANGNDVRLGARPLRRMMQRSVENIVAKKLLEKSVQPGQTVTLSADDLATSQS